MDYVYILLSKFQYLNICQQKEAFKLENVKFFDLMCEKRNAFLKVEESKPTLLNPRRNYMSEVLLSTQTDIPCTKYLTVLIS